MLFFYLICTYEGKIRDLKEGVFLYFRLLLRVHRNIDVSLWIVRTVCLVAHRCLKAPPAVVCPGTIVKKRGLLDECGSNKQNYVQGLGNFSKCCCCVCYLAEQSARTGRSLGIRMQEDHAIPKNTNCYVLVPLANKLLLLSQLFD